MADTVRGLGKYLWGGGCFASLVAYTVEYFLDQHGKIKTYHAKMPNTAITFCYIFILLSCIFGFLGAYFENRVMALIFTIGFSMLIVVDDYFVGLAAAFWIGQMTAGAGFGFAVISDQWCRCAGMGGVGGAGGGGGKQI